MNILETFAIIFLAGLVHATFQVSISTLTLMSGHAIGKKSSQSRLTKLTWGFILGVLISTTLLLCTVTLLLSYISSHFPELPIWVAACGLLAGISVASGLFYYKLREPGTILWLPRPIANYLSTRARKTKQTAESFALGVVTLFVELIFILPTTIIAGLNINSLPENLQLYAIILYVLMSLLPLITLGILIGGGVSISKIQSWREKNKGFLQFTACAGLIIICVFVYVNHVYAIKALTGVFNG